MFCAAAAAVQRVHPADTPCVGDGSPVLRKPGRFTRSNEGLPGFWAVLFERAVVVDPAGCVSLLAHGAATAVVFRLHEALDTQDERRFVAAIPTAHSLAYLRIAERVAAPDARLATGMGGLAPHRAGFAPAGRQTKFHDFIASSIPFDQPCLATPRTNAGEGENGAPGGPTARRMEREREA